MGSIYNSTRNKLLIHILMYILICKASLFFSVSFVGLSYNVIKNIMIIFFLFIYLFIAIDAFGMGICYLCYIHQCLYCTIRSTDYLTM